MTSKTIAAVLLAISLVSPSAAQAQDATPQTSVPMILEQIRELESNRDPKCYATAARLEDFMFGTPLTEEARFAKAVLQKQLVATIWRQASKAAETVGETTISADTLTSQLDPLMSFVRFDTGEYLLLKPDETTMKVSRRDADHYLSIAYGYRAILAAQQDFLLDPDPPLPLSSEAIRELRTWLDLLSLSVLGNADSDARALDQHEIQAGIYTNAWRKAVGPSVGEPATAALESGPTDLALTRAIIAEKLAAFEAYNDISQPVFMRNLQVYFARFQWPSDPAVSEQLRLAFNESMIAFMTDILQRAEARAMSEKRAHIMVDDVHAALQEVLPYEVNEYEDVIFFPHLPSSLRITLEAYDTDAFRDSGLHWKYLSGALDDLEGQLRIEPDPFAAELLTEGVAQFGVLVLRAAGLAARESDSAALSMADLAAGYDILQKRVQLNASAPSIRPASPGVRSSATSTPAGEAFFADVTAASGIAFEHRSSDWLSRQLRSYLKKDEKTGTLTIPPAFGGAGIAAADLDLDGDDDVLLLSGLGNALYANRGNGTFENISESIPLDDIRPDNTFGEPRQPIIADFDNDGLPDILITYVDDDHRMLRNLGKMKFENVSSRTNLGGKGLVGGPATAVDINQDGLLDLYIGYFGDYLHGNLPNLSRRNLNALPNHLFLNLGNFRFRDVTEGSGTDNTGWTQAMSHTDFDGDGRQDLIVGNDFGVNAWLHNDGDGHFTDWADRLGTGKPSFTMNVGISDLNADEKPDVYISNIVTMVKDEKYVLPDENTEMRFNPNKLARMRVIEANDLFLSGTGPNGAPEYELSEAVGRGFSSTGWSWDADFFDFDLDGDDDLYVLNGMNEYMVYSDTPYYTAVGDQTEQIVLPVAEREPNVFFVNEGGKLRYSEQSGAEYLGNSRSAVYIDIDEDGDLDMIVNNYHGPALVFENRAKTDGNHWLKILLVGDPSKKSNRDAIGATILATGPGDLHVWREIHGTEGYLSGHPREQHLGLGTVDRVDLEIHWPNGERQTLKGIEADHRYVLKQGEEAKVRD